MDPNNFLAELKRRNVYKIAVAYLVGAWLLIQVATQVFPFFEIPNWAVRLVVLLLVAGFPVALVFSWVFEITPEGIKRESEVPTDQSITHHTGKKIVGLTIALAVVAAGLLAFQLLRPKASTTTQRSDAVTANNDGRPGPAVAGSLSVSEKSIAVLPFENLSSDKDNAYFAEGIQDEILTRLAKIAALKVISRTSTQKFKSAPDNLREIGKQLGVANVLEGSVQKIANAVHVNVQLIRASNDEHIWAESYNRKLDDVFGVEGEVASTIAEQLNAKLSGAEAKAIADKPTENAVAYDIYLRGIAIETNGDADAYKRSAGAFAQAVSIEPKFALAWARLAIARSFLYFNGQDPAVNTGPAIKEAADRAISLQSDLPEALLAQGVYRYRVLRDFEGALQSYQEAFKRLPGSSLILEHMAHVERRLGRLDAAQKHYEKAAELDPRNLDVLLTLSSVFASSRQFDDAQRVLDRVLQFAPDRPGALAQKAYLFQAEGELDKAAAELAKAPADSNIDDIALARFNQFYIVRNFEAAIHLAVISASPAFQDPRTVTFLGICQQFAGRKDDARATFQRAVSMIAGAGNAVPIDARTLRSYLALDYQGLGQKDKALQEAKRAVAEYKNDVLALPFAEETLATVQAWFGDLDPVFAALPHLLSVPNGTTLGLLRTDPKWDPIRKDPRFAKLIGESKVAAK